jgi:hypothetical protein
MQRRIAYAGILILGFLAVFVVARGQQDKSKRPSPPASADCKLTDGKTIHVDYSSPRMNGRRIFGGLVSFGKPWRVGANEATSFVTTANLNLGGKNLPAGNYTLFAIPSSDTWTLIVSRKTGEWGEPYPGEENDFTRAPMTVSQLPAPVENFKISFDEANGKCTMRFEWETTRASIEISAK